MVRRGQPLSLELLKPMLIAPDQTRLREIGGKIRTLRTTFLARNGIVAEASLARAKICGDPHEREGLVPSLFL